MDNTIKLIYIDFFKDGLKLCIKEDKFTFVLFPGHEAEDYLDDRFDTDAFYIRYGVI